MDLSGGTALVTGGNRGIGRAVVEELAKRPLELLLVGMRDTSSYEEIAPPGGGAREVRPVAIDLSSHESTERSCDEVAELDRISLLVNNAGQLTAGLLEEQELEAPTPQQNRRGGLQRVAASRAEGHRGVGAAPRHAGRRHASTRPRRSTTVT